MDATAGSTRLYDAARAYELAFGFHDLAGEADAIQAWTRRALGREPRSFLELACGPAWAGVELARRGAEVVALDLSPAMCERARARARDAGTSLEAVVGDMTRLDLGRTFDAALCMTESLCHVATVPAMIEHLRGVARHLVVGGAYVIEQLHPRDVLTAEAFVDAPWSVAGDGVRATTTWGTRDDPWDPIRQVRDVTVTIHVEHDGRTEEVVRDRCAVKLWTATEMEACVLASGAFDLLERHGDFAAEAPFTNERASWRMISVLRRR